MTFVPSSRALTRGYGRRVETAIFAALLIHAAVFLLAPPYVARPYRLEARPLRLITAAGLPGGGGGARVAMPTGGSATPVASAPAPRVLTEQIRVQGFERPEAASGPGPSEPSGGSGSDAGNGAAGDGEGPPPVFYAFDAPPQVIGKVDPEYPLAARLAGAEGTVVLNANVDETGRVKRVWVAAATAPEALVQSAVDALYRFRFTPGSQQGVPVTCTVAVPFNFRLNIRVETNGGRHER